MSEKSTFAKPLSAAIGKATGVFSRPKLQRRAFTAHAASELISAANLSSVLLDLKENGTKTQDKKPESKTEEEKTEIVDEPPKALMELSPRLSTCIGEPNEVGSNSKTEGNPCELQRRNSDTVVSNQNNNNKLMAKEKNLSSLSCFKVKAIISETLKAHVGNMEYNHRECGEKCRVISQIIEKRVKTMNNSQYKVIVLVFIGALRDKGIELATQCIWSPTEDYFAMATYKNETVFASGIVLATIFE